MDNRKSIIYLGLLCLVLASPAAQQIQSTGDADFLFINLKQPLLYPETDYRANAAVLAALKNNLFTGNLDFIYSQSNTDLSRMDNTIGKTGGTYRSLVRRIKPLLDLGLLLPGKKICTGLGLRGDLDYSAVKDLYNDYNAFTEKRTDVQTTSPFNLGLDYFTCFPINKSTLGLGAGYTFGHDPKVVARVTDESISPTLEYTDNLVKATDDYIHSANLGLGTVFSSSTAWFSLAAGYQGAYKDSSRAFIAVDKDQDGKMELLLDYATYMGRDDLDRDNDGQVDSPAILFDQANYTITNIFTLHPALRVMLARELELLLAGTYRVLGYEYNKQWMRYTTADDPHPEDITSDKTWQSSMHNTSFQTFDVLAGVVVNNTSRKSQLRLGLGYSRFIDTYSQDGDTRVGLHMYNALNTNNYTELNLGINPENNSIKAAGVEPSRTTLQELFLQTGLEWVPLDQTKVKLFWALALTGQLRAQLYYAYNLDTRSVWQEQDTGGGLALNIDMLAGITFPVTKDMVLALDYRGSNIIGDFIFNGETAPFDAGLQRLTENGDTDLAEKGGLNFSLTAGLVLSY